MAVLSWDKPEKIMSKADWKSVIFDGGPPGSYIPNMSEKDRLKWKAKFIGGKYARVEIRKTTTKGYGVQMLIVVSLSGTPLCKDSYQSRCQKSEVGKDHDVNVKLSMNGSAHLTFEELDELTTAIAEARQVLEAKAT
jgi:hypothetical protein